MQNKSLPWLDWIRFLTALVVVLAHSRHLIFAKYAELEQTNAVTAAFYALTKLGNEAVLIFFVLSGFLVGGIAAQRLANGTFNLKSYSIDRFSRIMVPLVPALILTVSIDAYLSTAPNWPSIFGNLFSLQGVFVPQLPGNEALWTLSYESWFYILAGGIGLFLKNRTLGAIVILTSLAIFTKLSPDYLICWLIGAAASVWRAKKSYILLALSLVLLIYGCIGRQVGRGSDSVDLSLLQFFVPSEEVARIIFSTGFALLLQQLILVKKYVKIEAFGGKLAAFSYTLYLTHFPIIHLYTEKGLRITTFNMQSMWLFTQVMASCLAAALIMYFLFERNTKYVRNWLKR